MICRETGYDDAPEAPEAPFCTCTEDSLCGDCRDRMDAERSPYTRPVYLEEDGAPVMFADHAGADPDELSPEEEFMVDAKIADYLMTRGRVRIGPSLFVRDRRAA